MTTAVSGKAFLGIVRSIRETAGPGAVDEIAKADPLLAKTFAERIRVTDWHAYDAYALFLRTIDRRFGGGDPKFLRGLGARAGERDLGTIFRVYVALASPERLIRSCSKVWASYYRGAGQMEAISWTPENTRLIITGFSKMAPEHCRLMEGWMISTMLMLGCRVSDDAHESICASRGGQYHEFVCTWTKA